MTAVIADTDILSTFGKIGRIDLLVLLFHKVYVASAVYHELLLQHTPISPTPNSTGDFGQPRL
jgi:predicted nucleic acid-binding protein